MWGTVPIGGMTIICLCIKRYAVEIRALFGPSFYGALWVLRCALPLPFSTYFLQHYKTAIIVCYIGRTHTHAHTPCLALLWLTLHSSLYDCMSLAKLFHSLLYLFVSSQVLFIHLSLCLPPVPVSLPPVSSRCLFFSPFNLLENGVSFSWVDNDGKHNCSSNCEGH